MGRVQSNDPRAFALLYDRMAAPALGLAVAMIRDRRQAEDVVQEAFLSAWRSRDSFDPRRGTPTGWLMTIVRNRALDAMRSAATRQVRWAPLEDADSADPASEDLAEQAARSEDGRAVRAALAKVPPDQATVLRLAYFGGLSQTEIARRLAVPLGTVKSRARAGLRRLTGELAAAMPGSPPDSAVTAR